jgi:hypothetical protein
MPIDFGSISAMVASLRAAADMTKAMIGIRDTTMIQDKVIELQQAIMSAQSAALLAQSEHAELMDRIHRLERTLSEYDEWEKEKARYFLRSVHPGAYAYVLRPESKGDEVDHWLCTSCFTNKNKSILQKSGKADFSTVYKCTRCNEKIMVDTVVFPLPG